MTATALTRGTPGAPLPKLTPARVARSEWIKLRSVRSTVWALAASAVVIAGTGLLLTTLTRGHLAASGHQQSHVDAVRISLFGMYLAQLTVGVLGVLLATGEYATGMIRATLAAMPRRTTVLAAKAAVVTAVTLAAGTVAVFGSVLAGRLILPGHGYTPANGYPVLSLANGTVLRAAAGTVLYLALIALLSLGVATAVRDAAVAIGLVLGLLYLFPILTQVAGSPGVARHLQQIGPMTAGLEIQASTGLRSLPIGPWAGLGVLAAWAAAALLAGGLLLRRRDA